MKSIVRTDNEVLSFLESSKEIAGFPSFGELCFVAGDSLVSQGQHVQNVFVIKQGLAKCYVTEENGKEFIQEFFGSGQLVGEIEILLSTVSFSNVVALSKGSAIKIPKKSFLLIMENYPFFNRVLSKALAIKLRDTAIRASYQQTYTTENTLRKLLKLSADTNVRLEKTDIASYLGITGRAFNRLLVKINSERKLKFKE